MYLFRRLALLLAIILSATYVVQAEEPSSSSSSASVDPAQAHTPIQPNPPADQQTQPATQPQAPATADTQSQPAQGQGAQNQSSQNQAGQTQGQISVQARIRARREQRRALAIHQIYDHLWDGYVGAGYLRFHPGPPSLGIERVNMYDWNFGFTRYFSERLGATVDGRGYYGTPFLEPIQDAGSGIIKPAISFYTVMGGPTYRFYIQPKYSVSGRVMAGYARGNFTGDTNGEGSLCTSPGVCALWPDGSTFAAHASIFVEINVTPSVGLRIAPEYMVTGFGSTLQNGLGYTCGLVYRFGKQ
jgi:hypothetical protein